MAIKTYDIFRITKDMKAQAVKCDLPPAKKNRREWPWWLAIGIAVALLAITLLRNGQ